MYEQCFERASLDIIGIQESRIKGDIDVVKVPQEQEVLPTPQETGFEKVDNDHENENQQEDNGFQKVEEEKKLAAKLSTLIGC